MGIESAAMSGLKRQQLLHKAAGLHSQSPELHRGVRAGGAANGGFLTAFPQEQQQIGIASPPEIHRSTAVSHRGDVLLGDNWRQRNRARSEVARGESGDPALSSVEQLECLSSTVLRGGGGALEKDWQSGYEPNVSPSAKVRTMIGVTTTTTTVVIF